MRAFTLNFVAVVASDTLFETRSWTRCAGEAGKSSFSHLYHMPLYLNNVSRLPKLRGHPTSPFLVSCAKYNAFLSGNHRPKRDGI
jgi:hypothetical protein